VEKLVIWLGLVMTMYAIAKKVVKPAMISVLTFEPRSEILKNLSMAVSLLLLFWNLQKTNTTLTINNSPEKIKGEYS
jgi:hypothetical protein